MAWTGRNRRLRHAQPRPAPLHHRRPCDDGERALRAGRQIRSRRHEADDALPALHHVRRRALPIRVDHVSPRPGRHVFYAIQGTHGCYESHHGFGDASKVWLDDEHKPSLYSAPAQWHPLSEQAPQYVPERLVAPPEARSGGHGTSEYWMLKDFIAAVHGEMPAPIDVYRALDYTLPGICAAKSAAWGGSPVMVSDPRDPSFIGERERMPSIFMRRPHLRDLPAVPPLPVGYDLREAAGEADVPALRAPRSLSPFRRSRGAISDARQRLTAAPDVRAVYVVTWQGAVVATASSRYLPEQFGETGIIHWVGTQPEHARRGLGAALVTCVLVDFILRGYPDALLETQEYRLDAIRLYLRFGFTPAYDIGDGDQRALWSALFPRLFAR